VAVVTPVFLDTTVLLGGCIDFGAYSAPSQLILDAVVDGRLSDVRTAWHCCLEFYAVSTRLPPGYRLSPRQACSLLGEILAAVRIEQLPARSRASFLQQAAEERVAGGRIYDSHIAAISRIVGAGVVVTENRRHFSALLKYGVRVLQPREFAEEL
jgi:hypothetical protein